MSQIKIGRLMIGICQTNCYFVYREGSSDVIFFDPADKGEYIYEALREKGYSQEKLCEVMKQAQEERKAGQQVLVSRMNKNKKFQKEQLKNEGYEEIVEFFNR